MNNQINLQDQSSPEFLKLQGSIIRKLNEIKHPDPDRVSREIIVRSLADHEKIDEIITRLSTEEPIEYIFGDTEFDGNTFKVTTDTLIPRIETEVMVKWAEEKTRDLISHYSHEDSKAKIQITDLGTGTGAIIVSVAKRLTDIAPDMLVFNATDLSTEALAVAKQNATSILGDHKINFINSDILTKVEQNSNYPTLILANLPYIPTEAYLQTQDSVLKHEPRLALDGGADGLDVYRKMWSQICDFNFAKAFVIAEMDSREMRRYLRITQKFCSSSAQGTIKDQMGKARFVVCEV